MYILSVIIFVVFYIKFKTKKKQFLYVVYKLYKKYIERERKPNILRNEKNVGWL